MDYLEQNNIFAHIEESFRPAKNDIDFIALKNIMGPEFKEDLVE